MAAIRELRGKHQAIMRRKASPDAAKAVAATARRTTDLYRSYF